MGVWESIDQKGSTTLIFVIIQPSSFLRSVFRPGQWTIYSISGCCSFKLKRYLYRLMISMMLTIKMQGESSCDEVVPCAHLLLTR